MAYRTAAPAQPSAPTGAPVRHFSVGTLAWVQLILLPAGLACFAGGALFSNRSSVACARAAPGEPAACVAEERVELEPSTTHFRLDAGPIETRTVERSDDPDLTYLRLGGHELRASVGEAWAAETAAGARAFLSDPRALRWEASRWTLWPLLFGVALGMSILALVLFLPLGAKIQIDPERLEIRVLTRSALVRRPPRTFSLRGAKAAHSDSIDDSNFESLVLVGPGGPVGLTSGRPEHTRRVAREINLLLRDCFDDGAAMPSELRDALRSADAQLGTSRGSGTCFAGWADLDDDEKWRRMEGFLAELPVDAPKIVRKTGDRRVELRGEKRGFPVRVVYDPVYPGSDDLRLKVESPLAHITLVFDEDATPGEEGDHDPRWDDPGRRNTFFDDGVHTEDATSAEAFGSLPGDLRRRVCGTMRRHRIRYFRIYPKEITAYGWASPLERRHPVAHLSAILELLGEVAAHVRALPRRPSAR